MTSSLQRIDKILNEIDECLLLDGNFDTDSGNSNKTNHAGFLAKESFGKTESGEDVLLYTLRNRHGMAVEIITYGGHIRSVCVPDRYGKSIDVTIGLDTIADYETRNRFFGCIVGRYANRICKGKFTLNDGKEYTLAVNNGPNALHGGVRGFDKYVWTVVKEIHGKQNTDVSDVSNDGYDCGIALNLVSPHMSEGYPAQISVTVTYLLKSDANALEIRYNAVNQSENIDTVINLTNHAYWDLNGMFVENGIANGTHKMKLNAQYITEVDQHCIPTGNLLSTVTKTQTENETENANASESTNDDPVCNYNEFDFSEYRSISDGIDHTDNEQIAFGNGYDHDFVITHATKNSNNPNEHDENGNENKSNDNIADTENELVVCANVRCEPSGIEMVVHTTEPSVQLYTANYLNGEQSGKGFTFKKRCSFCLETQHFPDSPNHASFPSTVLKYGSPFNSITEYEFKVIA